MVLHDMSLNPNQAVVGKLSENDWGVQAIVSWVLAEVFGTQNLSIVAEEDTDSLSKSESLGLLDSVSNAVNEALSEARKYGLPKPDKPLGSHDILKAIGRCNSTGGPKGRHWVLDPVDGTLGFVRGDQYAVALALIEDGKVLLGVLGCPNYSVKKERLHAEVFIKFAQSSYKEKIWDHAAGVVIVEEAGGVVTDAGGRKLDFSKGVYLEGLDRGIIACSRLTTSS
ncbi:hypothetical protein IGI04_035483 [Brassica rapa subsp. trilocularis]|uniref:3'(2'),5'-bisphosphate nucleotidase n=3 Tax=Brassica TaxID=3705 RepID=A0A8D9D493_BRACM|nr:hypothetical protein IGI04_035483 [Brassica rapa subsp. trilocularis]CAF2129800.1 unnamed protein product [Brassica napus]CAG7868866.1 unnamed protein product [Brassica rapa]